MDDHVQVNFALEEELDLKDPLRHLMDIEDGLTPAPMDSMDSAQLLQVFPQQTLKAHDKTLHLTFSHTHSSIPSPVSISLIVDASSGCGGIAWPAGQILASYLVYKGPDYLRSKKVLELGSGTGLVGLVAGILTNTRVCITDQAPLLPVMRENVSFNQLNDRVVVAELDWAVPIPPSFPRPDIILAADCVYFEPAFPLLVQTLSGLAGPNTEILFSYKKRRKADKRFFAMLKKKFRWAEVLDDLNREIYNREAISLLRITRREEAGA